MVGGHDVVAAVSWRGQKGTAPAVMGFKQSRLEPRSESESLYMWMPRMEEGRSKSLSSNDTVKTSHLCLGLTMPAS
jgi:hypothetical protein